MSGLPSLPQFLRSIAPASEFELDDLRGRPETEPIRIAGKAPTVFCIHGFTGVPFEVKLACEAASDLGLAAEAPLLAGHGTTSAELARLGFVDWVASVRGAFDAARKRGPVILVGLSLGSLVATDLLLSAPGDVLGLAVLSNAFWLRAPYPSLAIDWADRVGLHDIGIRKTGSDLGDADARESHVSYSIQPVSAAISLLRAGETMRERLCRVHRPTLVLHGARDQVCPVKNAWKLAERLGTRDRRIVIFPESHHILTRDIERDQVAAELRAFFSRLVANFETAQR